MLQGKRKFTRIASVFYHINAFNVIKRLEMCCRVMIHAQDVKACRDVSDFKLATHPGHQFQLLGVSKARRVALLRAGPVALLCGACQKDRLQAEVFRL